MVGLFLVSWFLRRPNPDHPSTTAFVLSCVGIGLALITGWLGGELVERLGIGVAEGAHPDAPSSLSDRAVSDRVHKATVTSMGGPRSQPPM